MQGSYEFPKSAVMKFALAGSANIAMLLAVCFLFAVGLLFCSHTIAANEVEADDEQRLQAGEVIISILDKDLSGGAARAVALFQSDVDTIWEVIGKCENEFVYVKGMKECEVLQPGDTRMVLRHRVRNSWYTPTLDYSFIATRTNDRGEANLLDGNLKVLQGSWELKPLESGNAVLVTHEIRVQPEFPAPRWLIRRSLSRDLPDMLACIRALANASGDQAQAKADLQRCPGDVDSLAK